MRDRRAFLLGGAAAALAAAIAPARAQPGPRGPFGGPSPGGPGAPPIPPDANQGERILDAHAHLIGRSPGDFASGAKNAVETMDQLGIARTIILPPPQPPDSRNLYDYDRFAPALSDYPGRFAFLGGGGTLNPPIQQFAARPAAPEAIRRDFTAAANRILAAGAVGFGEITAEHLSYEPGHPYESAAPDSPLLLLLADIAAERGVPIDFHMDAAREDRPSPPVLADRTPNNPKTIPANIARFERLLAHNRGARFVWAHAGRDQIGDWTTALSRELLGRHPNLYMSVTLRPQQFAVMANFPFGPGMTLKPDWIALLTEFPDRFVIGSDHFYAAPQLAGRRPGPTPAVRRFVNMLPAALAAGIARENAERLYKIKLA